MKGRTKPVSPDLAIALLVLIWGSNFSVVKFALREMPPLAFNALRFVIASATLALLLRLLGVRLTVRREDWRGLIGFGVLGNTVYQVLFILGLSLTLAGNASLMLSTVPVFVALLSVAWGHERIRLSGWLGILLSLLGIGLVVLGGSRAVGFGTDTIRGDLISLGAAVVWSFYTVGITPHVRRYGTLPVTAVTMWVGTLGLLIVGLPAIVEQPWAEVSAAAWAALLFSGVFAIAVAYILWNYGVRHLGSSRTALFSNTIPIIAILVAWATIGEVPSTLQISGATLVLSGIGLARAGHAERPERVAT